MKYKLGLNNENKPSTWVRIQFNGKTDKQMNALFKAQSYLHKAGVNFDSGYNFCEKRRDWEFNWSLKGAQVILSHHYKKWWQFWK
jgi:hypothetical protein